MVAQLTTDNVNLLTSVAEAPYQFQLSTFVGWLGMEAYKFIYYTNLENPYNMNLYLLYGILVVALLYVLTLKLIEYKNGESLFLRRFPAFSMLISQVTIVATLFSCMPKGLVGGGEKNDPPFWLAASFVNGGGLTNETPSVTDPPGTFSPAHYSGLPVSGMYFIHPDHLGSTSMLADGLGRMVAGVDINSGKSYVSYKPYGEVNRTNSSGPDIFRYKFNKQESDSETGLYYYGARYYDPFIGRFTQADSLIDTEDIMGFNQYMYTNGNPVNYTDPTGHNAYMHMFGSIIKNMVGGLKWMSKGLQRAADTVSRFTYGVHHHKNSLVDKIARSDRGVIQGKINKWLDVKVIDPMMHMNLRDILITIAVAAAIFALGVLIGPAIAGAAAYVAGGG
ncbi:MAG: RHS repeat-associated core domain-containing protein [Leptospiraceae bacterium]|nr:RHS repeat-associated core domain-containing protein [Leptospiraceae bacterium]